MKRIILAVLTMAAVAVVFTPASALRASALAPPQDDAQAAIDKAVQLNTGGDLDGAVALLEKSAAKYPGNADILAYLGFYTGQKAGTASDMSEAGMLTMKSFELLGKAIEADPDNPRGYLYRGIMGIKVPPFLGKLDDGIKDLIKAEKIYSASAEPKAKEGLMAALTMLDEAYTKKGDLEARKGILERIIRAAPGSDQAADAQTKLSALPAITEGGGKTLQALTPSENDTPEIAQLKKEAAAAPEEAGLLLKLGKALYEAKSYKEASEVLKAYVAIEDGNADAYKMLAASVAAEAQTGYDKSIHENTDYMSGLAFDILKYYDKAVELAPQDMELRLTRGRYGILMPFFLSKLDQGVADLEMVAAADVSDEMKSEALYYLGVAKRKEALVYWTKVARKFPDSEAAKQVYRELRPDIERFDPSKHEKPFVLIDFVLGFQDQLAPQTAVWIEDADGNYVATVYVSGFAGFVKEKQVTLPEWAASSEFKNVDGVTGASIDVGHHHYTWDLKSFDGKKVKNGKYRVMIETSFWPTMKYQMVTADIEIGKKASSKHVEEGDFIPMADVSYFPK